MIEDIQFVELVYSFDKLIVSTVNNKTFTNMFKEINVLCYLHLGAFNNKIYF